MQAIAAARRALADDPTGIDPRVALAVLAFDKDMPGTAVQTLDSMSTDEPANAEIRFHLGLLLFWTRDFQDAAGQMRQVLADHPRSPTGAGARVFERCLTSRSSCSSLLRGSGLGPRVAATRAVGCAPSGRPAWWPRRGRRRSGRGGR